MSSEQREFAVLGPRPPLVVNAALRDGSTGFNGTLKRAAEPGVRQIVIGSAHPRTHSQCQK
jgi:hypothetical protein